MDNTVFDPNQAVAQESVIPTLVPQSTSPSPDVLPAPVEPALQSEISSVPPAPVVNPDPSTGV